ncbi:polysaccharide pyruvyl transferase family protein [Siccirubricoccus deserti]
MHSNMEWHQALELFDAVQLPIFAIGVGAQASSFGRYQLDDRNLRFWKTVAERSTLIGVRGTFTAEVLAANGIKNVEVVGCPSLFRARKRDLQIRPGAVERVAFSIRREAGADYATSVERYREEQREMLLRFARRFALRVTTHGEVEEKAFVYRNAERMQQARKLFLQQRWWTEDTAAEMERLYGDLFFFLKVSEYDDFIRTQDLAVGYRVHGVLPALANGVPGILVTYDARCAELADTHAIPAIATSAVAEIDPDRLIAETSYDVFNKLFAPRYDKMRFVLEQNGLPHRMG